MTFPLCFRHHADLLLLLPSSVGARVVKRRSMMRAVCPAFLTSAATPSVIGVLCRPAKLWLPAVRAVKQKSATSLASTSPSTWCYSSSWLCCGWALPTENKSRLAENARSSQPSFNVLNVKQSCALIAGKLFIDPKSFRGTNEYHSQLTTARSMQGDCWISTVWQCSVHCEEI